MLLARLAEGESKENADLNPKELGVVLASLSDWFTSSIFGPSTLPATLLVELIDDWPIILLDLEFDESMSEPTSIITLLLELWLGSSVRSITSKPLAVRAENFII